MAKVSEKTVFSFKGNGHNVKLVIVHDYRPFDRYFVIDNRHVYTTSLTYGLAVSMYKARVIDIINQLKLF